MITASNEPTKQRALLESNASAPSTQTNQRTDNTDGDDCMGVTIHMLDDYTMSCSVWSCLYVYLSPSLFLCLCRCLSLCLSLCFYFFVCLRSCFLESYTAVLVKPTKKQKQMQLCETLYVECVQHVCTAITCGFRSEKINAGNGSYKGSAQRPNRMVEPTAAICIELPHMWRSWANERVVVSLESRALLPVRSEKRNWCGNPMSSEPTVLFGMPMTVKHSLANITFLLC